MMNNEKYREIRLSQHSPMDVPETGDDPGEHYEAHLEVDVDQDSSFSPSSWVHIIFTDEEHDADRIKLTFEEAARLHERLSIILGRPIIPRPWFEAETGNRYTEEEKLYFDRIHRTWRGLVWDPSGFVEASYL